MAQLGGQFAGILRIEVPELDWSAGAGPSVTGAAHAVIGAILGRAAFLPELTGDGVEVLRSRC